MVKGKYYFFWSGPFSQWAQSPFILQGIRFNTCEQWMMWNKAKMFGDEDIAEQIIATKNPKQQKALGRKVRNFDDNVWMSKAYHIVVDGNRAKFTQNQGFRTELELTKGLTIVEASPYDRRWGIGMGAGDPGVDDPANWRGENLLGQALTQLRHELFGE